MSLAFATPLSVFPQTSRQAALRPACNVAPLRPPSCLRPARCRVHMCRQSGASEPGPLPRELSVEVKELRSLLKKCSIFLVGPMGSGKSVVGRYLARELGFRFVDTDAVIEEFIQKPISQMFAEEGEHHFRDVESTVLEQVSSFIACVVSTGGGVVIRKENWGKLHCGIVIYLDVPVDVLHDRLQSETENRPLLNDAESLRDRIKDILHERDHLYRQADIAVKVSAGMAVDEIGKEIVRTLTNFIKANPPKLSTLYPGSIPNKS